MATLSRRAMVAGLACAPAILTGAARAQTLRKISLTLPFLAEGSNAFVWVARAKGYWENLGLDVTIARGTGSTSAVQAVGTGQFQFGIAAATSVMQQIVSDVPIINIACAAYDSTMGICVPKDSPIQSLADLAGRSLASAPLSGDYPFLPAFAKQAGFDLDKVKQIKADPNIRQRLLTSGQVDAISGFAQSYVPPLVAQNFPTRSFLFSDHGLKLYNLTLFTTRSTIAAEPKLCEDMVTGLMQGLKFTALNPDQTVALFSRQVPETALSPTAATQIQVGSGIFTVGMLYEPMLTHGMGYAVPEDFAAMADLVMRYLAPAGAKAVQPSAFYTNEFAGRVVFSAAEWSQAQSLSQPYRQYLT